MESETLLQLTKRRRAQLRGVLLLGVLLAACNMNGDVPAEPQTEHNDGESSNRNMALALGPINSPVFDELEPHINVEEHDGSQDVSDYDLVIFDGDAHGPEAIRDHEVIRKALQQGKWVLALDVTGEHKQAGLGAYLHAATKGESNGYFARTAPQPNGHTGTQVLEFPSEGTLFGDVADGLTAQGVVSAKGGTADGAAQFVDSMMHDLTQGSVEPQQVGDNAGPAIPKDIIYYPFYFRQIVAWKAGGAQKANKNGSQKVYYELNYNFELFLDNKQDPQGDFQWVSVQIDGNANPTQSTSNFVNWADDEKAWWQDRFKFRIMPSDRYNTLLGSYKSSPETANGVTKLTTKMDFTVDFNAEGPSAEFGYHSDEERDVTDWKVTNNSSAGLFEWDYRSATPDADQDYGCANPYNGWVNNGFNQYSCYPNEPSALSKGTLSVHAQGVWKTDSVLSQWVDFDAHSEQHVVDTYCARNLAWICGSHPNAEAKRGGYGRNDTFSVNMAAVVPIPIKSINFDQNPAMAGQEVTGTVTLESPAQVNTTIQLSSNNKNATVKSSVVIPPGQTSAEFQVLTNANSLAPGASTAATIEAFYADDYQAQLTVINALDLAFEDTKVTISQNPTRTGTVTLPKAASASGDINVNLTMLDVDNNPSPQSATLPSSVTIPRGKTSASIPITFKRGGAGEDNAFGFFLVADGGAWGKDKVEFIVTQ